MLVRNSFGSKKIWVNKNLVLNFFGSQKLGWKFFWVKKNGSEIFWAKFYFIWFVCIEFQFPAYCWLEQQQHRVCLVGWWWVGVDNRPKTLSLQLDWSWVGLRQLFNTKIEFLGLVQCYEGLVPLVRDRVTHKRLICSSGNKNSREEAICGGRAISNLV